MFELGTTKYWWTAAKKYPVLSHKDHTLKPLGYAHMVNLIETHNPKNFIEIGHGAGSYLFQLFKNKMEIWGLDDEVKDSSVSVEDLKKFRGWNPHAKFVDGLLGTNVKELPDNYFDFVCSVSVMEHIPHEQLNAVFEETYRILKPGGIVAHSYDVYFNQNTKPVFDAHENAGFEWLKPRNTMNVFWEEWLSTNGQDTVKNLFNTIVMENPMIVAEVYMWQQEREKRYPPINFVTILTAARKPVESPGKRKVLSTKKEMKQTQSTGHLISPDNFSDFSYSKKSHFNIFNSKNYGRELTGKSVNEDVDLKMYQDLLVYSFIRENFRKGSRILRIGSGNQSLFKVLKADYECWSINNADAGSEGYRNVKDEIGNFNKELPDDYFDFAFSVSDMTPVTENGTKVYEKILIDIRRVLKPGGFCLNCIDVIRLEQKQFWANQILNFLYQNEKILNKMTPFEEVMKDTDLFVLPEKIYNDFWKKSVGKPYEKFVPFSVNLLWKKPENVKAASGEGGEDLKESKFISPENFDDFTYCKKSHYDLFFKNNYDIELYGKRIDPDYTGMKRYQDLMVYSFIKQNIPKGSKILDIGGGDSRILKHFKNDYECWNIDKLEGLGGGPVKADTSGYRLVRDYMGNFNKELPDNYFDLVMSISTLEHVPQNDMKVCENILKDINRVLKPGGYSLQLIDILLHTAEKRWVHPILPYFFENEKIINKFVDFANILKDPDQYKISEKFYNDRWERIYNKSFAEFGTDVNYSLLWRKPF